MEKASEVDPMMFLRACPRCKQGDLYLDEDNARHCFQCGHVQHTADASPLVSEIAGLFGTGDWPEETAVRERVAQLSGIAV